MKPVCPAGSPWRAQVKMKKTKLHFAHCNAPQIVFLPGHRNLQNAASNLTTGLHHKPHFFDFEPARLSAAHLGAGETSETNIKV